MPQDPINSVDSLIIQALGGDPYEVKAPEPQDTGLSGMEWLQMAGATTARIAAPAVGTLIGAAGGPLGAVAGGALGGAAGEAIGQLIEPRSQGLRPASIAVGAGIGAIPGSWMLSPGKAGASALRGAAIGGAS